MVLDSSGVHLAASVHATQAESLPRHQLGKPNPGAEVPAPRSPRRASHQANETTAPPPAAGAKTKPKERAEQNQKRVLFANAACSPALWPDAHNERAAETGHVDTAVPPLSI
jgi:hypothetical protein